MDYELLLQSGSVTISIISKTKSCNRLCCLYIQFQSLGNWAALVFSGERKIPVHIAVNFLKVRVLNCRSLLPLYFSQNTFMPYSLEESFIISLRYIMSWEGTKIKKTEPLGPRLFYIKAATTVTKIESEQPMYMQLFSR